MTPKEKAEALVGKYFKVVDLFDDEKIELYHYIQRAKQCALIAVDEMLNSSPSMPIQGEKGYFYEDIDLSTKYWQQVKQEIESL